jgi:hypothetical protein
MQLFDGNAAVSDRFVCAPPTPVPDPLARIRGVLAQVLLDALCFVAAR